MNSIKIFASAAMLSAALFLLSSGIAGTDRPEGNSVGSSPVVAGQMQSVIAQSVHAVGKSGRILPQSDTLIAGSRKLMVYNTGRLGGGNDSASLDIPGDCDADLTVPNGDMYLRDASPVIAWNDGSESIAYTTLFTQSYTEPGTFVPQSDLHFSTGSQHGSDYNMVCCTVSTSDSLFAVGIRIFAPTDPDVGFIIAQYEFGVWMPGLKGADEVYVGFIANWDIPADVDAWNGGGFDETRNAVYQYGHEADAGDTDEDPPHSCPITENDRFGGIRVIPVWLSQWTGTAWTAQNGPMMAGSGFDSDSLFARMSDSGHHVYSPTDTFDLHTGIVFDKIDMSVAGTHTYTIALAASNAGMDDFLYQLDTAYQWANPYYDCCQVPGDANHDGVCNIADVVYIIDLIFHYGPWPPCYDEGDVNDDCGISIGDPVYIINYVFKNGPAPLCGCVPPPR